MFGSILRFGNIKYVVFGPQRALQRARLAKFWLGGFGLRLLLPSALGGWRLLGVAFTGHLEESKGVR
jgi:hypothetical protein